MLDIKFIRENPQKVKEGCKKKNADCDVDKVLELDERRRELVQKIERLRSEQNKLGKADREKAKGLKGQIKEIEPQMEEVEGGLKSLLTQFPNIPFDDVPVGDESKNVVLRQVGKVPAFNFEPKDHLELGEALDIIDVKRAAKVSGARFAYLKGEAALLEFALVDLVMKTATKKGFIPIVPPVFVRSETMQGMGYVDTPEDLAERYFFGKEGLFLVGTGEQSVGPMHADEIFEESELPKRYVAFSTCFREEAGSYGKDTRGILRVHQFDKVELFSFCTPQKSKEEHEFLIAFEEKLWQTLKIPYQVVHLATGDMSRPSASTYDIEAWMPGQNKYREVSSASNVTDYQARRLNIRYKNKGGLPAGEAGKLEFVHMLNATGFPIGRTLVAILENYQQKDGSVKIPGALQGYMGKKKIERPA
ncbi:MAG: serine--tRNA ligase [Candidatus Wildermuthbacteria bacterium]|nr:serine--tRNA ligase [Candidatus Wildermuthbacteria bacterium]